MCGQWGEDGWARKLAPETVKLELPVETLESLADDLASFKPAITLFGGEPLMFSEWERLVRALKSRHLRVNMITNGTLLDKFAEKTVDLGIDELIFSLDGPEEVHDSMRSGKGIFRKATEAFGKLAEYKRKTKRKYPKVNVNTTIFETNYQRLAEVVAIAESIGADAITFHHLIFLSEAVCAANSKVFRDEFSLECRDWVGFARDTLPDIDVDYLIETLHELKKRESGVSVSVYPNYTDEEIRAYYSSFEFKADSYAPRCISPWRTAYIFPNGDVKPCLDTCYIAGNILERRFTDIWNGEPMRNYRSVLKKMGHFPACTRCTEFYRS